MTKLRVVTVKYLNTKPFINGIQRSFTPSEINLMLDHPAQCAEDLLTGNADIGLVPIAAFPELTGYQIFSDFCIGCNGPVNTVKIYSQSPLSNCNKIFLDYQSRTSVQLATLILKNHLNLNILPVKGYPGFENEIVRDQAGLVIGDRCFHFNHTMPYQLDLGQAWKDWTGLPFVFAVWVCKLGTDPQLLHKFNLALNAGVQAINKDFTSGEEVFYLTQNLSFSYQEPQKIALNHFLHQISQPQFV